MQIGYGATKLSKRSKHLNNPRFQRVRENPCDYAKGLLKTHTQKEAHSIAAKCAAAIDRTICDGAPGFWTDGKSIRRDRGFWHSVAGYLSKHPKPLEK